jgi:hypothetical protein
VAAHVVDEASRHSSFLAMSIDVSPEGFGIADLQAAQGLLKQLA